MNWMNRFNVGARTALVLSFLVAALALVGGSGALGLNYINTSASGVVRVQLALQGELAEVRESLAQSRRYEKDVLLSIGDPASVQKGKVAWDEQQARLDGLLEKVGSSGGELGHSSEAVVAKLKAYRQRFEMLHQQIMMGALESAMAANRLVSSIDSEFSEAMLAAGHMQALVAQSGEESRGAMQRAYDFTLKAIGLVMTVTLVAAAYLGWLLRRSLVLPLEAGVAVAERIARGDLSQPVTQSGTDEVSRLVQALGQMQRQLGEMVAEVSRGAGTIEVASGEISQGNLDLSMRTERQASGLQETASGVSALAETVQLNADAIRRVNALAKASACAADNSGCVVSDVVETMSKIASSSTRVSEIVGLIDGIAFQTNILALNAAVEAARAGEQGRGFAVVAAEVRTLAQRSSQAAREIRTLIEQSGESVQAGTTLVSKAGSAIQEVVQGVNEMAHLLDGISSATQEQSHKLHTLSGSIVQIDQMTQQNAALVEQTSAASASLKQQADQLSNAVSVFRLNPQGA
jgi:methyl-accepting chemotaxis protein